MQRRKAPTYDTDLHFQTLSDGFVRHVTVTYDFLLVRYCRLRFFAGKSLKNGTDDKIKIKLIIELYKNCLNFSYSRFENNILYME